MDRYIVVRSDLETKEDGRKEATQFFDQLGRVRLAKTLEDATTQSATNETDGIKVQTRYKTVAGYTYQLSSNPYRANYSANETGLDIGNLVEQRETLGGPNLLRCRPARGLRRLEPKLHRHRPHRHRREHNHSNRSSRETKAVGDECTWPVDPY